MSFEVHPTLQKREARMSPVGKLSVTSLLAWIFVVGPLLTVAAGISLVVSLPSLVSTLARVLVIPDKEKTAKMAVEPLPMKQGSSSTQQQLELLGATLAALGPVPALVPAEENASAYVRDAIVWQFDKDACKSVVGTKHATSGILVAECDSGEKVSFDRHGGHRQAVRSPLCRIAGCDGRGSARTQIGNRVSYVSRMARRAAHALVVETPHRSSGPTDLRSLSRRPKLDGHQAYQSGSAFRNVASGGYQLYRCEK